jgi:mannonate dehydratase
MQQSWRWFGSQDKVSLRDARQAGAEAIVSALHNIPVGDVWPIESIRQRQAEIRAAGMEWAVVESLGVSERIKVREQGFKRDIENYVASLRNLAACGIRIVAYNLMPVFSWIRTDVNFPLPDGALATRFDATAFAAFELFVLKRKGAEKYWGENRSRAAHALYKTMDECQRLRIFETVMQGLPGGHGSFTLEGLNAAIERYEGLDADAFRTHAAEFLSAVCPVAEELGIRLSVHPDDPPRALLGLPRIVSTEDDLAYLLKQWPGEANGLTFCTGALGARPDNNILGMVRRFASRIWFAHLRSTQREEDPWSFFEAAHLEGDTDLISVTAELLREEIRRKSDGDLRALPFRPDHGHQLLNDPERNAQAGYPAIGRLRGLAELRGVMLACQWFMAAGEKA